MLGRQALPLLAVLHVMVPPPLLSPFRPACCPHPLQISFLEFFSDASAIMLYGAVLGWFVGVTCPRRFTWLFSRCVPSWPATVVQSVERQDGRPAGWQDSRMAGRQDGRPAGW